jgi:hypothetical protein
MGEAFLKQRYRGTIAYAPALDVIYIDVLWQ